MHEQFKIGLMAPLGVYTLGTQCARCTVVLYDHGNIIFKVCLPMFVCKLTKHWHNISVSEASSSYFVCNESSTIYSFQLAVFKLQPLDKSKFTYIFHFDLLTQQPEIIPWIGQKIDRLNQL